MDHEEYGEEVVDMVSEGREPTVETTRFSEQPTLLDLGVRTPKTGVPMVREKFWTNNMNG